MDKVLSMFLDWMAHERKLSVHTVNGYRRDLEVLQEKLQEMGARRWQDATARMLQAALNSQRVRKLSPSTLNRYASSLRMIYDFMFRQGMIDHNPAEILVSPRRDEQLPQSISVDTLEQLLQPVERNKRETRNLAIFELLYSSGLRVSELTGLNLNDYNAHNKTIKVMGKGQRERVLPVGQRAIDAIDKWLAIRKEVPHDALFLGDRGRRISRHIIKSELHRHAIVRGIEHINPHRLRHAFATHMLESSSNLRGVQEMLGHSSIDSTQVYTHLDFSHLSEVYDKTHPRSGRKR